MKRAEDAKSGLMVVDPDDSGENSLRFGRMKYDAKRGYYTSDCVLPLEDFVAFPTKSAASKLAKKMGFGVPKVERIGSRFWTAWGIRNDFRDTYFLASFE